MNSCRSVLHRTAVAAWLLLFVVGISVTVGAEPRGQMESTIEVFAEDGTITRLPAPITPNHPADAQRVAQTNVDIIQETGSVENRIAIVMLGDGYTQSQLGTYAMNTMDVWQYVIQDEPFTTYQFYFNVYRVNVVSQESGVDNDPIRGITRDTALDMGYWCRNTARALCINHAKAQQYAAQAPKVDQLVALANSDTYGGTAWADVVTMAGRNIRSPETLVHELGHSLGSLADEYVVVSGQYGGTEPFAVNTSMYTSTGMLQAQVKWYRWLGEPSPDGGLVGTYEGANNGDTRIYRPSENSVMRTLGKRFNSPGREALVMAMYRHVRPIDSSTPITATLMPDDTITVTPLQPIGHDLTVTWRVNGTIITAVQDHYQLHLADLVLNDQAIVTVEVTDPTSFVRDEAFRTAFMRETRQWTVTVPAHPVWSIAIPMALDGGVETP